MDLQKKNTTYFPQYLFLSLTALKGVRGKHRHNPLKTDHKYKRIFNYKLLSSTKVY